MMKRIITALRKPALVAGFLLSAAAAFAQTYPGQFPANTVYGNATGSQAAPTPGQVVGGQIANGTVTNANHANMAAGTVKGSLTGGAPIDLTAAQLGTLALPNNVKSFGAAGSNSTTTGTITATQSTLTLAAAIDFQNGQGIRVNHAGAAFATNPPTALTVTPTGATGATTYTYTIASLDAAGGIGAAIANVSTNTGNATLSPTNFNQLSWTAPASGPTPAGYAVYGRTGGSLTLLAIVTAPPCCVFTSYKDTGTFANSPYFVTAPDTIPTTPPGAALADWLVTTISSGGGTTSLTLAAAATTNATTQTVGHDDTTAIQNAINAGKAIGQTVTIPTGVYPVSTAFDAHNINQLNIQGQGCEAPTFGVAFTSPTKGSVILGQTGLRNVILDLGGSNNVAIRDLCFSTVGAANPSSVGLYVGTSAGVQTGNPGGSAITLANFGVQLIGTFGGSVPVYFNGGAGASAWSNVWTLGDYGLAFSGSNALAISGPYSGAPSLTTGGIDGMSCAACQLLTWGPAFPLYIDGSSNYDFDQLYVATETSGANYPGQPYAISLSNVHSIHMRVEEDFMPSLINTSGTINNVHIFGSVFPSTTPIPANVPIVGQLGGTSLTNSDFRIVAPGTGALAGNPFFYATGVATAASFYNNSFWGCDTTISTNCFFGNIATGAVYRNLYFNLNSDAPNLTFEINGGAAGAASLRYYLNGKLNGTL